MERQMARSSSRSDLDERRIIGSERAVCRVEAVDPDLVEAKIRYERKAAGGVEVDGMRMWPLLTLWIRAVAAVLHKGRGLT